MRQSYFILCWLSMEIVYTRKVISHAGIHNEKREVVSNDVNEKEMLKCMN